MSHPCRNDPSRPLRLHSLSLTVTAVLVVLSPATVIAAKTDVIVLQNGDRITGEVKGLGRGKLDYSTDDAGRLAVEWTKVKQITSPNSFEVEVASGAKYVGRLVAGRDGMVVVVGARSDTLPIASVVRINTLNAGFAQRTQAYLDLGLTYAKANSATTFTTSGEVAYRGDQFGSRFWFDSYAQGQESVPTTTRNAVSLQGTYYLPKRWSAVALARAEQNDELDLEHRFTGSGLLGRALVQSNSNGLGVAGGLAVSQEQFAAISPGPGGGESNTSFEGVLAAQWDAFRFDAPTLDFSTSIYVYPSFSNPGRVRGEFTSRLKYELFPDFDVGVTITDNFDSDPPEESAPTNDFITTFTVGWSYRR